MEDRALSHRTTSTRPPMAERIPHDDDAPSLPSRLMTGLLRGVLRAPVAIVALATGLAALGVAYSSTELGYKTSRHDLVNAKTEYGRL